MATQFAHYPDTMPARPAPSATMAVAKAITAVQDESPVTDAPDAFDTVSLRLPLLPDGTSPALRALLFDWEALQHQALMVQNNEESEALCEATGNMEASILTLPAQSYADLAAKLGVSAFSLNGLEITDDDELVISPEYARDYRAEMLMLATAADARSLAVASAVGRAASPTQQDAESPLVAAWPVYLSISSGGPRDLEATRAAENALLNSPATSWSEMAIKLRASLDGLAPITDKWAEDAARGVVPEPDREEFDHGDFYSRLLWGAIVDAERLAAGEKIVDPHAAWLADRNTLIARLDDKENRLSDEDLDVGSGELNRTDNRILQTPATDFSPSSFCLFSSWPKATRLPRKMRALWRSKHARSSG
jgi:hypothetical protein